MWHFFIERDEETRLIAHNIAVRDDKGRSLGEFDVLYENRITGEIHHLELAVKFFLELPAPLTANPLSRWLGPNSADRLDLKLNRLLEHQLPLAHTPEGLNSLRVLGVQEFSSQLQVGGILFRGPNASIASTARASAPVGIPPADTAGIRLSNDYLLGDWQSLDNMDKPDNEWRMLPKPDWLGASYDTATPVDEQMLKESVSRRPIMLINTQNQRRFIVPDGWPQP